MPVQTFVDDPEPEDLTAPIWRYVEFWKLEDLITTRQLYLRRADKLNDEHEGLPPVEYERVLNLNKYDLNQTRNAITRSGNWRSSAKRSMSAVGTSKRRKRRRCGRATARTG